MSARKTRVRAIRRDRRKAKASGFERPGKKAWGGKVGHGSGTAHVGMKAEIDEALAQRNRNANRPATSPNPQARFPIPWPEQ